VIELRRQRRYDIVLRRDPKNQNNKMTRRSPDPPSAEELLCRNARARFSPVHRGGPDFSGDGKLSLPSLDHWRAYLRYSAYTAALS
jgi:hypothetical protein